MIDMLKPHVIAEILGLSIRTVKERTDWTIAEVKKISEKTKIPLKILLDYDKNFNDSSEESR